MLKRNLLLVGIGAVVLWGFGGSYVLAQETQGSTSSSTAMHSREEGEYIRERVITEAEFKKSLLKNSRLVAYRAFRNSDTGICGECGTPQSTEFCWSAVKHLAIIRLMAKGQCDNISNQNEDSREICKGLRSGCSGLTGVRQQMCNALKNDDLKLMKQALSNPDYPEFTHNISDAAEFYLNVYNGFRNGSKSACDRFRSNNLVLQASCDGIFGSGNYDSIVDSLAKDLVLFDKAKKMSDKTSCGSINNPVVKAMCMDDSVRDTSVAIEKVWH